DVSRVAGALGGSPGRGRHRRGSEGRRQPGAVAGAGAAPPPPSYPGASRGGLGGRARRRAGPTRPRGQGDGLRVSRLHLLRPGPYAGRPAGVARVAAPLLAPEAGRAPFALRRQTLLEVGAGTHAAVHLLEVFSWQGAVEARGAADERLH